MASVECACPCNTTRFTLHTQPEVRFYCHCGICQQVYGTPFSDFIILKSEDVTLPETGIEFHKLRPPPNLGRGLCTACVAPVAGVFNMVPGLSYTFVPVANIRGELDLPASMGHLFYHNRVEEVQDDKPKLNHYLTSQLAVSKAVFKHLLMG